MDCTQQIEELNSRLTVSGQSYRVIERKNAAQVSVEYVGEFQQKTVIWQVDIGSIPVMLQERQVQDGRRQYIDIQQLDECHFQANVALNRNSIRDADILATMIMIRKYKRLSLGRHEYGDLIGA